MNQKHRNRGRPKKSDCRTLEQRRFESKCSTYGFTNDHYQRKAFVWSDYENTFVEAQFVGFTSVKSGDYCVFSYIPTDKMLQFDYRIRGIEAMDIEEEEKQKLIEQEKLPGERRIRVPMKEAALDMIGYAEDILDMMDDDEFTRNPAVMKSLKEYIEDDRIALKNLGVPYGEHSINYDEINFYGSVLRCDLALNDGRVKRY